MAIIYTYSKVTPTTADSVVITDASDNNYTKTALLSDVIGLATTYTFDVPLGTTDLNLAGSDATNNPVTITGGTDITVTRTSATQLTIDSTASDTNTTYDLTAAANVLTPANMLIKLTGSDATVDTVTLVPGANITLADLGGNKLEITSTGGGSGTVTSVGTSNAMGGTSGITFVASTNPIVATGTIDLSFSGAIGDMWFAETVSSVQLLHIGTSTTTPTGSVINQVLAVDPSGANDVPAWTTKEIAIQNAGVDVETATNKINFTGTGVIASTTGPGTVEVAISGGSVGNVFTPILVTQGSGGLGTLTEVPNITYITQYGRWSVIGDQVYIDFYIEFEDINTTEPAAALDTTLGVSAFNATGLDPVSRVLGFQGINMALTNLNVDNNNNAGVHITELSNSLVFPDNGWQRAPQGGKLNKFHGAGTDSSKSVAWLHWLNDSSPPSGLLSNLYETAPGTPWTSAVAPNGTWTIAGSLNPINVSL